jgi:hypothetical protein
MKQKCGHISSKSVNFYRVLKTKKQTKPETRTPGQDVKYRKTTTKTMTVEMKATVMFMYAMHG